MEVRAYHKPIQVHHGEITIKAKQYETNLILILTFMFA